MVIPGGEKNVVFTTLGAIIQGGRLFEEGLLFKEIRLSIVYVTIMGMYNVLNKQTRMAHFYTIFVIIIM